MHLLGNALLRHYLALPLSLQIGVAFTIFMRTGLPLLVLGIFGLTDLMLWLGVDGDPVGRDRLW